MIVGQNVIILAVARYDDAATLAADFVIDDSESRFVTIGINHDVGGDDFQRNIFEQLVKIIGFRLQGFNPGFQFAVFFLQSQDIGTAG